MTGRAVSLRIALLALVALAAGAVLLFQGPAGTDAAWAQERKAVTPKTQKSYEARLYEVYVFSSGLDVAHGLGTWVREVHVPELGLSFNKAVGPLIVFPESGERYAFRPPSKWGDFRKNARLVKTFRISAEELAILKAFGRARTEADKVLGRRLGS